MTAFRTYPLTVRRSRFAAARILSASSRLQRMSSAVRSGFIFRPRLRGGDDDFSLFIMSGDFLLFNS
jgi:hypothetical protein